MGLTVASRTRTYRPTVSLARPLLLLGALGLVCLGQYYRLYRQQYELDALIFFAVGGILFAGTLLRARTAPPVAPASAPAAPASPRWALLLLAALFAGVAWQHSSHNAFTAVGLFTWFGAVLAFVAAFWAWRSPTLPGGLRLDGHAVNLRLSWHTLALIALLGLAVFLRLYRLDGVPPEMNSDHSEKLLDVLDVLGGRSSIYFERNTGREPLQIYTAAALSQLLGTGLSYYTLKLSSAILDVISVVGVYLLGREVGGRRLGLLAGFFAAVSIWSLGVSRDGLRHLLTAPFSSLALWLLLHALRTRQRNDWLAGGVVLGAGLYGYMPFRVMPLAAAAVVALFALARWPEVRGAWRAWLANLALYGGAALLVFLPLGHYMIERPEMYWYRIMTRVGETEHALPGNPLALFAGTFSRSLGMFNWRGDSVWVATIPVAPALDTLGGGLFLLGVIYAVVYLGRRRTLLAAQLLAVGLIFLLPASLNLAFPGESPSVIRSYGAMPVVAVLVGLVLLHLADEVRASLGGRAGPVAAGLLLAALLGGMAWLNYDRYFTTYLEVSYASTQNPGEVARAVSPYLPIVGGSDHVYLKNRPYWLDSRSLALEMTHRFGWENGHVALDGATLQRLIQGEPGPALYILGAQDAAALATLRAVYPAGRAETPKSRSPGREFTLFYVPPR